MKKYVFCTWFSLVQNRRAGPIQRMEVTPACAEPMLIAASTCSVALTRRRRWEVNKAPSMEAFPSPVSSKMLPSEAVAIRSCHAVCKTEWGATQTAIL